MPHDAGSLWDSLSARRHELERGASGDVRRTLWGVEEVSLDELAFASSLGGRLDELRDRAVLVATGDQLTAALALIELDGVARRLIVSPPDLSREHVPHITATAEVDALVSDRSAADVGAATL